MAALIWSIIAITCATVVNAHSYILYPGQRGDNLILNATFPYGMQWAYPCGGIPTTTNRTKWPVTGGGISIQPGWFTGHATALMYINLGLGTDGPDGGPPNMSFPMVPTFEIIGPSNNPYPGSFCLPQVPLPANVTVNVGDLATIQVVETAVHGGALYNCVDIIFALQEEVPELNTTNCFNSTTISFKDPFAEASCGSCTTSSGSPTHMLYKLRFYEHCNSYGASFMSYDEWDFKYE
ncbi:hypothetical protein D0Z07_8168 [Hyphodiscus hymeniophilus]|uniref:Copper acquisition factor BIM1-like domain-containing protein n=1 Tax=Hyphodiscus hymeniophilus TaxID=353542 RepID=A0A9P6SNG4_9HELO|nr:hypothetical protein D0Z07_8168 [Hyphodiscus hymeniophilus]